MALALITKLTICPSCGDDWSEAATPRLEYCPRCGSPVAGSCFDPLRTNYYSTASRTRGMREINRRAKLVVRFGILGMGVVGLFTGLLLSYGGWLSPTSLDPIQLWVSRVGGPLLLVQGSFYAWLPFRRPLTASILRFTPKPRSTTT